jgi:hypothetical protein
MKTWREILHVPQTGDMADKRDDRMSHVTHVTTFYESESSSVNGSRTEAPARPCFELARAYAVLDSAGVRLMEIDGVATIGVWSDLDSPGIREALSVLGSEGLPVRYLDGAGIPARYKLRYVDGEPVPLSVLQQMEQRDRPWRIRDELLKEMKWCPNGILWNDWRAARPLGSERQAREERRPNVASNADLTGSPSRGGSDGDLSKPITER